MTEAHLSWQVNVSAKEMLIIDTVNLFWVNMIRLTEPHATEDTANATHRLRREQLRG
jgi:hypothetical protein